MIKIAFYGKGGIGKSTTVSNIAIALAQKGLRVLQIGCDPKADSTRLLCRGDVSDSGAGGSSENLSEVQLIMQRARSESPQTIMDFVRSRKPFEPEQVVRKGFAGVLCAEAGGPLPGQGCAGRAVITALEKVEELGIYEKYEPDLVLFDVLGDVVCGGFAMPMRAGFADFVYILTSGETMSLYAAAKIGLALQHFQGRGYAKPGGLILNCRDVPDEKNKVMELAGELNTELAGCLSRSETVLRAEEKGQCVLQAFPDSEMADQYRELAESIAAKTMPDRSLMGMG